VSTRVHDYHLLSGAYDTLAWLWSLGAIDQSRSTALNKISNKSRVLIPGAGTCQGFGALSSASCHLTLVDSSPAMLSMGSAELCGIPKHRLEIYLEDIRSFQPSSRFSSIWLPYFLNVFSANEVVDLLGKLKPWLQEDGEIYISDFLKPDSRFLYRVLQEMWHGLPMAFFYVVTGNAWHKVHDLPRLSNLAGYRVTESYPCNIGPKSHRWIGTYVCKPISTSS